MRKTKIALSTLAAVLATAAVAVAVSGGSSGSNPSAPTQTTPATPGGIFGALRRTAAGDDAVAKQAIAGLPVKADSARLVRVGSPLGKEWISAGPDYTCITGQLGLGTGGTSCTANDKILDGVAVTLSGGSHGSPGLEAHENVVFGAVPDGATNVEIVMRDSSRQPVAIGDEGFVARVDGAPAALEFIDSSGKSHSRPLAYCDASC